MQLDLNREMWSGLLKYIKKKKKSRIQNSQRASCCQSDWMQPLESPEQLTVWFGSCTPSDQLEEQAIALLVKSLPTPAKTNLMFPSIKALRGQWLPGTRSTRGAPGLVMAGPGSQNPSHHARQEQGSLGSTRTAPALTSSTSLGRDEHLPTGQWAHQAQAGLQNSCKGKQEFLLKSSTHWKERLLVFFPAALS